MTRFRVTPQKNDWLRPTVFPAVVLESNKTASPPIDKNDSLVIARLKAE